MIGLSHPLLDGDDEALWRELRGGGSDKARERLFAQNLPFARSLALRHFRERARGELELADFHQLACAGLLGALDHYDPERGVPFRAYAGRRISGSILNGIARMSEGRDQGSRRARSRRERIRSLREEDIDALSASDAMEALAEIVGGLALGFMLEVGGVPSSDDGEEGVPVRSSAYDSVAWRELVQRLIGELSNLPEREQLILRHHYLEDVGFDQIAALLGVSKGRVSQLHRAALALLRKRLGRRGHFSLER